MSFLRNSIALGDYSYQYFVSTEFGLPIIDVPKSRRDDILVATHHKSKSSPVRDDMLGSHPEQTQLSPARDDMFVARLYLTIIIQFLSGNRV
jgi:hypothetical protein